MRSERAPTSACAESLLKAHGIRYALANTGEFGAISHKPEGETWRIGIQHPRNPDAYVALAALDDRFLATSGDYKTRFSEDFSSHHIFDPATGRSPTTLSSVTVIAPAGLDADALSTAIFVLGPDKGLELAESRSGVEAFMVLADKCVGCGLCQTRCHSINVKTKHLLTSSAIVVEAGSGKEDRISSGSYLALREQERKRNLPSPAAADSYLPSFLKEGQ